MIINMVKAVGQTRAYSLAEAVVARARAMGLTANIKSGGDPKSVRIKVTFSPNSSPLSNQRMARELFLMPGVESMESPLFNRDWIENKEKRAEREGSIAHGRRQPRTACPYKAPVLGQGWVTGWTQRASLQQATA